MTDIENWPDNENPLKIAELVDYHLRFKAKLSDFVEETELLSDQVKNILYDQEDDKLGRIRDVYDKAITHTANWVEDNHETSRIAGWMLGVVMNESD